MLCGVGNRPGWEVVGAERRGDGCEIAHSAMVQLALDTETVRRARARRPNLVAQALLAGATPEQVAHATGLELDELRQAVGRWALRQQRDGLLTNDQYLQVINIVFGPAN